MEGRTIQYHVQNAASSTEKISKPGRKTFRPDLVNTRPSRQAASRMEKKSRMYTHARTRRARAKILQNAKMCIKNEKKCKNIWWFQKKVVPLHRI